jgi:hypothetical protein
LSMMLAAVAPAFAKQTDMPPDSAILYFSGGQATVDISSLNFPNPALPCTGLYFFALHVESSTFGSGDALVLVLLQPSKMPPPMPSIFAIPFAYITTNAAVIGFVKTVYLGTGIYRHAAGVPDLDNTRVVSSEELSVTRHGNRIAVHFDPDVPMILDFPLGGLGWPKPKVPLVLPAFDMEWDKVGGSIHELQTMALPKSSGLTGYTVSVEVMGFAAGASFKCADWNQKGVPVTVTAADVRIVMHGDQTFVPP